MIHLLHESTIRLQANLWLDCNCAGAFAGPENRVSAQTILQDGQEYLETNVPGGEWRHYRIFVNDWHSDFELTMTQLLGNSDVYVRKGAQPSFRLWDFGPA